MSFAASTPASVSTSPSSVSSDDSDISDTPSLSLSTSTCDSTSSVATLPSSYDLTCASPVESCPAPSSSSSVHPIRANEHLAVFLPRSLWKPNSLSTTCDTFSCQTPFTFFERRHHCRKCGGVYCSACSSRTTALLDVRDLPFLNPPKGVSVFDFAGVVIEGRVCDECWEQLHTPTTPAPDAPRLTRPTPTRRSSQASVTSPSSDGPCDFDRPPTRRSSIASVSTRASNPDLRRRALQQGSRSPIPPKSPLLETQPLPQGELSTYPLCRSSSLCKASGGGRWVPQPEMAMEERRVIDYDFPLSTSPTSSLFSAPLSRSRSSSSTHRPIPSSSTRPRVRSSRTRNPAPTLGIGKPLWEVEWEREVSREKRRRENPVVRDLGVVGGDLGFCLRVYPTAPNSRCGSDDGLDEDEAEYGYAEIDGGYRIEEVLGGKGLGKESVDDKPRRSFSLSTF